MKIRYLTGCINNWVITKMVEIITNRQTGFRCPTQNQGTCKRGNRTVNFHYRSRSGEVIFITGLGNLTLINGKLSFQTSPRTLYYGKFGKRYSEIDMFDFIDKMKKPKR